METTTTKLESAKRIIGLAAAGVLSEDYALIVDLIHQLVAGLQMQGSADRLRNGGLRLARQFADNHVANSTSGKSLS